MMLHLDWTHTNCPSVTVVKNVLSSSNAFLFNPEVSFIWEESRSQFGRDSFFDSHTKVSTLVKMCVQPQNIAYCVRRIYVQMLRLKKVHIRIVNCQGFVARSLAGCGSVVNFSKRMESHTEIFFKRVASTQLAVTATVDGQPELPWGHCAQVRGEPHSLVRCVTGSRSGAIAPSFLAERSDDLPASACR